MKEASFLLRVTSLVLLAAATGAFAASVPATSTGPALGQLDFPVTGSPECQRLFRQGMLELHSFQYERVVEARPHRALSLLGAARAARASGDTSKERAHYQASADLWTDADADLPVLAEVQAGAGGERRAAAQSGR